MSTWHKLKEQPGRAQTHSNEAYQLEVFYSEGDPLHNLTDLHTT